MPAEQGSQTQEGVAPSPYDTGFFDRIRDGSRRSAQAIVPLVLELTKARTVVDVGCGDGTWLSVFQACGATEILGLDGSYVDLKQLQIPQNRFKPTDLSDPFRLDRTFDLAVSLEVAEHLPPEAAASFVESLTRLAPIVLFSAALPFQGGTNHLNEQWPDYWAELFKQRDYVPVDCIRDEIWNNEEVEFWYVQNTLLFVSADVLKRNETLRRAYDGTDPAHLRRVHPKAYVIANLRAAQPGVRKTVGLLQKAVSRSIRKRLG